MTIMIVMAKESHTKRSRAVDGVPALLFSYGRRVAKSCPKPRNAAKMVEKHKSAVP
jgi:ribosomal protein L25 (general stress protein Ctc)